MLVAADRRAAELDADAALGAGVLIDRVGVALARARAARTGPEDDHRELGGGDLLGKGTLRARSREGRRRGPCRHRVPRQGGEVDLAAGTTLERDAVDRVALVPRHRGDAVVQDRDRAAAGVIDGIHEPGESRVGECRVADDGNDRPLRQPAGQLHTVRHADGRTHAHARIHRGKRPERSERVAADVAGDHGLELAKRVEHRAVRAAGAHQRRPRRQGVLRLAGPGSGSPKAVRIDPGRAHRHGDRSAATSIPRARSDRARYGSASSTT